MAHPLTQILLTLLLFFGGVLQGSPPLFQSEEGELYPLEERGELSQLEEIRVLLAEMEEMDPESIHFLFEDSLLFPMGPLSHLLPPSPEVIDVYKEADPTFFSSLPFWFPEGCREYYPPATSFEIEQIRTLFSHLADDSLTYLLFYRSYMEELGESVDYLHPLKFFLIVFSDDGLKTHLKNMRKRKTIWKDFMAGVHTSFQKSWEAQDFPKEYIAHFAQTLRVSPDLVHKHLDKQNWEGLIIDLSKKVPRQEQANQYDF